MLIYSGTFTCYTYVHRSKELGTIQSTFLFHGTELALNQTFLNKELHLFIVDPENVNQSIDTFVKLYNLRTKKRQEFWLLDITHWTKNFAGDQLWNQIRADFKDLKLDLDDDLYLFTGINWFIIKNTSVWKIIWKFDLNFRNWTWSNHVGNVRHTSGNASQDPTSWKMDWRGWIPIGRSQKMD